MLHQVVAVSSVGHSNPASVSAITPSLSEPPSTPPVPALLDLSDVSAQFSWSPPSRVGTWGMTQLIVQLGVAGTVSVQTFSPSVQFPVLFNLSPGRNYTVSVR